MTISKFLKIGFVFILVAAVVGLLFFIRMYRNDVKALKGFIASYDRFDWSIPSDGGQVGPEVLGPAGEALAELQAKASFRISSLIKNDGELMNRAREVADLARKELEGLRLGGDANPLRERRKAVFARFLELGRTKAATRALDKE